jgi:hypothetical protein
MKFLFLLLLTSCITSYVYYPSIPKQYISGKQDTVSWTCQNSVGSDAIWVRCSFKNEVSSDTQTRTRMCLTLAEQARDGFSGWAMNSRAICASPSPGEELVNYTAFEGDDYKRAIELCGSQLERCWLASLPLHPL